MAARSDQSLPSPRVAAMLAEVRAGRSIPSVARDHGISRSALRQTVLRWDAKFAPGVTSERRCLMCRLVFGSRGNRVCDECKRGEEWQSPVEVFGVDGVQW
jgi:hypothetical protein